jgi:hypothetical protein
MADLEDAWRPVGGLGWCTGQSDVALELIWRDCAPFLPFLPAVPSDSGKVRRPTWPNYVGYSWWLFIGKMCSFWHAKESF